MWIVTQANGNYRPGDTPFEGKTDLTVPVPQDAKTYDFFKLYLTNDVTEKIVQETNRYASSKTAANADTLQKRSMAKTWKPLMLMKYKHFLLSGS